MLFTSRIYLSLYFVSAYAVMLYVHYVCVCVNADFDMRRASSGHMYSNSGRVHHEPSVIYSSSLSLLVDPRL